MLIIDFSISYLFKGKTYPAKQRLTKFTGLLKNYKILWYILKEFDKTSQVAELKDKPDIESLLEAVCYGCADLMGGAGLCDNTLMSDLLDVSRIWQVGGGTSQIQKYVMSSALRQLFKRI